MKCVTVAASLLKNENTKSYIWLLKAFMKAFRITKMFNIRSTWIPAYFIDSPLCGLMRTTSRSESEKFIWNMKSACVESDITEAIAAGVGFL
ncbi:hypothetical protein Tco_0482906, partial [Tanacetum coccineum]